MVVHILSDGYLSKDRLKVAAATLVKALSPAGVPVRVDFATSGRPLERLGQELSIIVAKDGRSARDVAQKANLDVVKDMRSNWKLSEHISRTNTFTPASTAFGEAFGAFGVALLNAKKIESATNAVSTLASNLLLHEFGHLILWDRKDDHTLGGVMATEIEILSKDQSIILHERFPDAVIHAVKSRFGTAPPSGEAG